jgi:hypothetical protein
MYFNHAFRKDYIGVANTGVLKLRTTGATKDLTGGEIGLFKASDYSAIASAPATNTPFIIAQASFHTSDKIGPYHGGYRESTKSKVINPKYVTRFFTVNAVSPQTQRVKLEVCNVQCGSTYRLRIDVKGSPALRFLSHNLYHTFDAFGGCCADPESPVLIDPTLIAIEWAKQIAAEPLVTPLLQVLEVRDTADALVTDYNAFTPAGSINATLKAEILLEAAYADTKFGDCTFRVTDHYELDPLFIYASMTDESGDPCHANCFTSTETQAPRRASGVGETVLRNFILSQRYLQEPFHDGSIDQLRMREIEDSVPLKVVNRNGLYDQICLLHSVPRFNNPSGTFDDDQYLLVINVPDGTTSTALTTLITNILTAAGNGVALETL